MAFGTKLNFYQANLIHHRSQSIFDTIDAKATDCSDSYSMLRTTSANLDEADEVLETKRFNHKMTAQESESKKITYRRILEVYVNLLVCI